MNCSEIAVIASLYISGELDSARAAAVAAHLATCPECAGELSDERQVDDLLRAAVLADAIDTTQVDHRVRQLISAEQRGTEASSREISGGRDRPSSRPRWRIAAIGAVAATLLFVVGYRHLSRPHSVYADAAADHRSEVVDAHWRPWLTDSVQIVALAERSGVAPRVVLALAPPGYRLTRAKTCALDGRPFLHLVYSNGQTEFSAYLRPGGSTSVGARASEPGSSSSLVTASFGAEHLGCVQTTDLTAMFVTDESAATAADLARFAGTVLTSNRL